MYTDLLFRDVDPTQETNATVCPLCSELVEHSDDGWVHHLLDKQYGCEKNPRRNKGTESDPCRHNYYNIDPWEKLEKKFLTSLSFDSVEMDPAVAE